MSDASRSPSPADDEIDLGRLFGLLLDYKWWIAGTTLVFALIGVTYALLATPVYRAEALVQVEEDSPGMNPLDDVTSMLGGEPPSQVEIEIIRSRMVLGDAVNLLNLDIVVAPQRLPLIGDFLVRHGIERPGFADGWASTWAGEEIAISEMPVTDAWRGEPLELEVLEGDRYRLFHDGESLGEGQAGQLESFENGEVSLRVTELAAAPGARFEITHVKHMTAFLDLRSQLGINEQGQETGILNWSMTGPQPEALQKTLNTVADIYVSQNVRRQSEEARKSLEFLDEQVPKVRGDLRAAENRLNAYRTDQDSVDLSLETQAVLERLVSLESQLNELEFTETEISRNFTPSHPTYAALLDKKQQLERERAKLNEQIDGLPATQQEILRLQRDVEVSQEIYVQLLNKVQEMEIAEASTVGNVRILDQAATLPEPVKPNKPLIVVVATLLGGMLAVGGVLLRAAFHRGVEAPEQIQETGLSVYATVPLSEEQGKLVKRIKRRKDGHGNAVATAVLAERAPADTSVEALRGLRTSLHFAMLEAGNKRLMITGPSPGIGKSFITVNLGAVCAQAGQRVLVVDADMRRGHIHHAFGHPSEGGLSDLLSGKSSPEAQIRSTSMDGLDYVARGTAPPNPSELLMGERFTAFIEAAEARYDLVIIDTPPVLAVTDASVVGAQCGTTLMVARFQLNPAKEITIARERLENAGVTVKGAILNAMERKAATSYGYGYYNYSYK
ncbi:polysaccharide biosynthesis tyrosine autokinase [Halomonas sp. M4R1S46]|uniref:polysaccharide biosynthesis tyrosine autokinase n=1 Tax=Halomonas sp. M4R1S46 TaxID=2982692 RepID=UPI0021E40E55|nr:polysaccharide biosynthesis tyrosine autokinase [Halomonas sp. M4R1S46]UYG06071.1 polysaccharide biosynthesis tyrosine autokinase [Halomonas sp. M4R1S46]